MDTPDIELLLAPALMISACGVLMIAASTRATSVMNQVHTMHRERIELVSRLHAEKRAPTAAERVRVDGLELLSESMLIRARALRLGMIGIVLCVMLMLLCSVSLGIGPMRSAAVPLFLTGVASLFGSMSAHLYELARSLTEARIEHRRSRSLKIPGEQD